MHFYTLSFCKPLLTGQTFKAMTLHCWRKKVLLTLCGQLILSIHTFDLWHPTCSVSGFNMLVWYRAFSSQTSQHDMVEHKVVFLQLLLFLHKQRAFPYCIRSMRIFHLSDVFFSILKTDALNLTKTSHTSTQNEKKYKNVLHFELPNSYSQRWFSWLWLQCFVLQ